ERLEKAGVIGGDATESLVSDYRDALDKGEIVVDEWREMKSHSSDWSPYIGQEWDVDYDAKISKQQIEKLGKAMSTVPKEHKLHSRVQKVYEERMKMAKGDKPAD